MPSAPEPDPNSESRMPPPLDLPGGVPDYMWFDGILDGPRVDEAPLADAVRRINALGLAHADLEIDGGRFSILMGDGTLVDGRSDLTRRGDLVPLLDELCELVERAGRGSVESTLRATEVHGDTAVETMFAVHNGAMRPLSRGRPVTAEDRARAPGRALPGGGKPRRQVMLFAVLGIPLLALIAWRVGVIAAVFGPSADQLAIDAGPFGEMLRVEVKDAGLGFEVLVHRGETFPIKVADIRRLREAAETPAERAAVERVSSGLELVLVLQDVDQERLVEAKVSLESLLETDRPARIQIPSALSAKGVALRLAASSPGNGR